MEEIKPIENNSLLEQAKIEKESTLKKVPYWKEIGKQIFTQNYLIEKWNLFIERSAMDSPMDDIIQIMSLIQLGLPIKSVAQIIINNPYGLYIVDNYLVMFLHPEYIETLKKEIDKNHKTK